MSKWYRVSFNAHEDAVAIATVVHVKAEPFSLVAPVPSIDTVADNVVDWLSGDYRNMLTSHGALDTIVVREELAGTSSVPEQAERSDDWPGVRDVDDHLDMQICSWTKTKTNAAVRSGHGGFFGTPCRDRGTFNNDNGTILPLNPYAAACKAFADALLAGHDMGVLGADGHLSYIIYSRTRRLRGDSDYEFDATSCTLSPRPHFLRSRKQ